MRGMKRTPGIVRLQDPLIDGTASYATADIITFSNSPIL